MVSYRRGREICRTPARSQRHDEVKVLAESKPNTIANHVSTALLNGEISDDEFSLIIDEVPKYHQMKLEIRAGAQKMHAGVGPPVLDEETKKPSFREAGTRSGPAS